MNDPTPGSRRTRGQLWLLIALFFAPLLVAFWLYYGGDSLRPAGKTNHGDLVSPPVILPEPTLRSSGGEPVPPGTWRGKWSLVYIGAGSCDTRCREALTLMRQTRLALNDDVNRVQRVFLATEGCCDSSYLETEHAGLIVVRADDAAGVELVHAFRTAVPQHQGRIFIVDPQAVLMMSYAPQAPAKGLLEDLRKLLKLSRIG